MKLTRIKVLALALVLAVIGSVAGIATAALAAPAYTNNAQGAAAYAQQELKHYRAIPNGTHYRVSCTGHYIYGVPLVAGHLPVKVVCVLHPRSS